MSGLTHMVRLRPLLGLAWLLVAVTATGCGDDGSPRPVETIDREVFVQTYLDLRVTALETEEGTVTPEQRAEVLAEHGVTEEDLIEFARVHGSDPVYIEDVWNEVKQRIDSIGAARNEPS